MSPGARLRALSRRQELPTFIIAAAVVAVIVVLALRRHLVNEIDLVFFAAFIPAVIFHEVSHGVVALWCGDDTAKRAGRLTLNPIRHIDPVGSILLPAILALTHGPIFGWAKPVPVAINRLRHPRNQAVLVGLAGPATNIVLAAIAGVGFHEMLRVWPLPVDPFGVWLQSDTSLVQQFLFEFGIVNILLAGFNLIPIPPLDGSALIERLLPASVLPGYYRIRTGFLVLVLAIFLFAPGVLNTVLGHLEIWYFDRVI